MNGTIEAWDEDSNNAWAQNRNLHFRNEITEFSVSGELNSGAHVLGNLRTDFLDFSQQVWFTITIQNLWTVWELVPLQPLGTKAKAGLTGRSLQTQRSSNPVWY